MWNHWLITALHLTLHLLSYDGLRQFVNRGPILFDFADEGGMTHFGVSAKFLDALAKLNVAPIKTYPLENWHDARSAAGGRRI
jgi:acetoacetyl-CoA synthetase